MAHEPRVPGTSDLVAGFGRAVAGALLFGLPLLMTMEMWWLGFTMDPLRLAVLLLVTFMLLVRLSRYVGLRHTTSLADDLADALVAVATAVLAATALLLTFGVIDAESSTREVVGTIAIQVVPGSIGAILARAQLGSSGAEGDKEQAETTYGGELLLMAAGALFLSLNVAPTEEVVLIAYQMQTGHELALLAISLVLMHGFVYSLGFHGTESSRPHEGFWSVFARYTVVGYVLVLAVNVYLLWTFGRLGGHGAEEALSAAVVLGFPGAIGAAAARLVL